jgi:3-oxoadipate enol-lactonase
VILQRLVVDAPLPHLRWDSGVDGALCILLHGVGGGRESFGDAIAGTGAAIAEAGVSAIAVDLPGYGASASIEPYDMAGLAGALGALIEHLPDARIVLAGHSMGGMVVQEYMASASLASRARIVALVLCATTPSFGRREGAWQAQFLAQRLAPLDAGRGMWGLAPGLAKGMASPTAPDDRVARAAVLMSAVPEPTYRRALSAITGFDRRSALRDLRVPVLCLAGDDDRNAPAAVMRQMAERIPSGQFCGLPGVGHLMHMEAPQVVNTVLADFVRRALR